MQNAFPDIACDKIDLVAYKAQLEKKIQAINKNTKAVEDYKAGKQNSLQFLAGQIMKETRGTAKPETVIEMLKKIL